MRIIRWFFEPHPLLYASLVLGFGFVGGVVALIWYRRPSPLNLSTEFIIVAAVCAATSSIAWWGFLVGFAETGAEREKVFFRPGPFDLKDDEAYQPWRERGYQKAHGTYANIARWTVKGFYYDYPTLLLYIAGVGIGILLLLTSLS